MSELPLISICLPSYNHAKYVKETVESIWSQSYPNLEIVIVDDCSEDNSREVLLALKEISPIPFYVYFNEENLGPGRNIMKSIDLSNGEYIQLLATDDMLLPNRFEIEIGHFDSNPKLQIIYSNAFSLQDGELTELCAKQISLLKNNSAQHLRDFLLTNKSPFFIQAALFKRSFYYLVGGFDSEVLADDWVFNIRIFSYLADHKDLQFGVNTQKVIVYRRHSENLSRRFDRQIKLKEQVIEKYTPEEVKLETYKTIFEEQALMCENHNAPEYAKQCFDILAKEFGDRGLVEMSEDYRAKADALWLRIQYTKA